MRTIFAAAALCVYGLQAAPIGVSGRISATCSPRDMIGEMYIYFASDDSSIFVATTASARDACVLAYRNELLLTEGISGHSIGGESSHGVIGEVTSSRFEYFIAGNDSFLRLLDNQGQEIAYAELAAWHSITATEDWMEGSYPMRSRVLSIHTPEPRTWIMLLAPLAWIAWRRITAT